MTNNLRKYSLRKRTFLILSILHSLLLTYLTLIFFNQEYVIGDEKFMYRITSDLKEYMSGNDYKPNTKDYIFINNSYDNVFIDKFDEYGFNVGNQSITDRKKLSILFNLVKKYKVNYKYILCDIFFTDSSPADSLFLESTRGLINIIIPYYLSDENKLIPPLFNINSGLSTYQKQQSIFLKYRLTGPDTAVSVPMKMYEDISGKKLTRKAWLYFLGGELAMNSVMAEQKIKYSDVVNRESKTSYPYVNLGEFLQLQDSLVAETLKDKIIVIGDFTDRDMHNTIHGKTAGSLILINIFNLLAEKENILSLKFLVFYFVCFLLLSINVFSRKEIFKTKYFELIRKHWLGNFFVHFLGYVFFVTIMSLISYLFFNVHVNIVIIAIYFDSMDIIIKAIRSKTNKRKLIKRNNSQL